MNNAFHADLAEKLFHEGCNCSQAVFAAFCDETGFSQEDAFRLSSGFGGGFGRMREVCGAVSGMTLVLGCLKGNDDPKDTACKNDVYAMISRCMNEFSDIMGSYVCRDILKLRKTEYSPVSSERTAEFYRSRPCVGCIRLACDIVDKEINGENAE